MNFTSLSPRRYHCKMTLFGVNNPLTSRRFTVISMKLCLVAVVLSAMISSVGAFLARRHTVTWASPQRVGSSLGAARSSTTTALSMSDFDFPSAMPQKPKQTMKEKLEESVRILLESFQCIDAYSLLRVPYCRLPNSLPNLQHAWERA